MKYSLPSSIISPQDLTIAIHEVQDYSAWAHHETIKQKVGAHKPTVAPELNPATAELLGGWSKVNGTTADSYRQLIESLEHIANHAPTITITLAAPAPQQVKEHIVAWCRHSLAESVLVTFSFNSTILGGLVVRAGSHIYDWSLHRRLIDSAHSFTEVLNHV